MIVNRNNTPRSRNMKSMLNLIAMAAELAGRAVPMAAMARNDEDHRSRSRTCWEETLICGMHDDKSATFTHVFFKRLLSLLRPW